MYIFLGSTHRSTISTPFQNNSTSRTAIPYNDSQGKEMDLPFHYLQHQIISLIGESEETVKKQNKHIQKLQAAVQNTNTEKEVNKRKRHESTESTSTQETEKKKPKQDWLNRSAKETAEIKMEKKAESETMNELEDLSAEGNLIIDEDTEKLLDSSDQEETSNNTIEAPYYEIILKDDNKWTIEQIRPLPTTSEAPNTSEEPEIVILEEKIVKRYETIAEKVKRTFQEKLASSKLRLDIGKKAIGNILSNKSSVAPMPSVCQSVVAAALPVQPPLTYQAAIPVPVIQASTSSQRQPQQTPEETSILEQVDKANNLLDEMIEKEAIENKLRVEQQKSRRISIINCATSKLEEMRKPCLLSRYPTCDNDVNIAKWIITKICKNGKLPEKISQKIIYHHYKSYWIQKKLEDLRNEEFKTRINRDTPIPEYSHREIVTMLSTDDYCENCEVGHAYVGEECKKAKRIEARNLNSMKEDNTWRQKCQAIVIAGDNIINLPGMLEDEVILLNLPENVTYAVGRYTRGTYDKGSSYYLAMMEILQVVGLTNDMPIFIDYKNVTSGKAAEEYNYIGFVRICREIQTQYAGAIIPILGLYCPKVNETAESYIKEKEKLLSCLKGAIVAGRLLGVAVDIPLIQNMDITAENNRRLNIRWRNEPIFNKRGSRTKEWYRRLFHYFDDRIIWINSHYPLRASRYMLTNHLEKIYSTSSM